MTLPDGYRLSQDPAELQLDAIHAYLTRSYWSPGIPKELVAKAVGNSVCIGAYGPDGAQVGFARLVTDHATFGYLADVYVLEAHRGRGLSRAMVEALLAPVEVQGFRRILLATRDAHGLYGKLGFEPVTNPKPLMQILRKDVYGLQAPDSGPRG
jgi:GNAT superfamily N-acetyltransferase